jgi:hypothetical protein
MCSGFDAWVCTGAIDVARAVRPAASAVTPGYF